MKKIISIIIVVISYQILTAQEPNSLIIGGSTVSLSSTLKDGTVGGQVFLLSSSIKNENQVKLFGVMCSNKSNELAMPVIELTDNSNNKTIRTISINELLGNVSKNWSRVEIECSKTNDKIVEAFAFTVLGEAFKFYKTIKLIPDANMPSSKILSLSFQLQSEKSREVKIRFLGKYSKSGVGEKNNLLIGDNLELKGSGNIIVLSFPPEGKIKILNSKNKNAQKMFDYESNPLKLNGGEKNNLLEIKISATSIGHESHAYKQAMNLSNYFSEKIVKPDLAAITMVDKPSSKAGDTVLTTIRYFNIGTSPAADVVLDNPIPSGAKYIESSAGGIDTIIDVLRLSGGAAKSLSWKFNSPIQPGEERNVSFKLLIL